MSELLNATVAASGLSAEIATIPGNRYSISSSAAVQVQCKNLADSDATDEWLPVNIEERKIAVGKDGAFTSSFEATSTLTRVKAGTKAADVVIYSATALPTKDQVGSSGGACYADTTPRSSLSVTAIQVLSDAVFTTLTGNITGITGVTIPAGTVLRGSFTAITLTSGTIIAYA